VRRCLETRLEARIQPAAWGSVKYQGSKAKDNSPSSLCF